MSQQKPSLPKGTRDFGPDQMIRRNYILETIKAVYRKFGFQPIETPGMENLSVLTGKYGDEGDQLLFKILNSGDFLSKSAVQDFEGGTKSLLPKIAEKGLRYDLTVPFARFVVMNQHTITFPFKRYQIQPVWRADRPQKGRYREFYQCDADVVGTNSLICEAEIIWMIMEVFQQLSLSGYTIKMNNRKILSGIAEVLDVTGRETDLFVAIDKLDKIGLENVMNELAEKGFSTESREQLKQILTLGGSNAEQVAALKNLLSNSELGSQGISEVEEILNLVAASGMSSEKIEQILEVDITLARGLSYYTGAIFEVKAHQVKIGSITGGGRYDNLTGMFGLPDVSGVGISFGVDRIYDVLEELNLFPTEQLNTTQLLIVNFDTALLPQALKILSRFRAAGLASEMYPEPVKMKKQFNYADKNNIPFVVIVGPEEVETQKYGLKNMRTGDQVRLSVEEIIQQLQ